MTQPAEVALTWHRYYDNPRDDAILITKDNMAFRVSSRLLSKHCAIVNPSSSPVDVQDNSDQDVKPEITGLDPIHIDATYKTLELFLSMLSPITRGPVCQTLTFEQCQDLLLFTEQYDCKELVTSMRNLLIQRAVRPGLPPDLLLFASRRDDWALGRDAMRMIDASEVRGLFGISIFDKNGPTIKANAQNFFEKLRPDWQLVLMRLVLFGGYGAHQTQLSETAWKTFADEFVMPGTLPKRTIDVVTPSNKKARRGLPGKRGGISAIRSGPGGQSEF